MTIENLTYNHLEGLKELYENAFEGSCTSIDAAHKTFELIKDDNRYNILCAVSDGKVVGSVMGVVCHELFGNCRPFMVVENVAVLNSHRRKGIAKQLMQQLEVCAAQHNCSMILFVSSHHREGAHKLYESLGYGVDKVNGYRKRLE
jgi:predicted N-acetyltransferase YhbS